MDLLLIIVAVLGGLVLFALMAASFGADSRDSVGDDWRRRINV